MKASAPIVKFPTAWTDTERLQRLRDALIQKDRDFLVERLLAILDCNAQLTNVILAYIPDDDLNNLEAEVVIDIG